MLPVLPQNRNPGEMVTHEKRLDATNLKGGWQEMLFKGHCSATLCRPMSCTAREKLIILKN